MRRIAAAVVVIAVVAGAWFFRDRIRAAWHEVRGTAPATVMTSAELAAGAEAKLESLRDGSTGTVSLSAAELESVLVQRYGEIMPAFLDSPQVEIRGDQLRLRARVPIDKLPAVEGLSDLIAFMPDTTELAIAGKLLPLETGRVAFGIDNVSAARIPLPGRVVTGSLARLGRRDEPGLPRDAVAVSLPPGVATAYMRRDSLVLVGRNRNVGAARRQGS